MARRKDLDNEVLIKSGRQSQKALARCVMSKITPGLEILSESRFSFERTCEIHLALDTSDNQTLRSRRREFFKELPVTDRNGKYQCIS